MHCVPPKITLLAQKEHSKLQRNQNARARLVYSMPKFCHVTLLLDIDFKIILIAFKILNNMAPSYLSSLICIATPSRYSLRSACDGALLRSSSPVKSSKTLGDRAFVLAAPKLWNSLPKDIRTTTSLSSFKIKLKSFYLYKFFKPRFLIFVRSSVNYN